MLSDSHARVIQLALVFAVFFTAFLCSHLNAQPVDPTSFNLQYLDDYYYDDWKEIIEPLGPGSTPEYYAYYVPPTADGGIMVAWHGMRGSVAGAVLEPFAYDSLNCYQDLDTFCHNNKLILFSPLCKDPGHFGHIEAQKYCTAAINHFRENVLDQGGFPVNDIDINRVYMVGFSMGAGSALNYACRHLRKVDTGYPDPIKDEGYPVAGLILNAGFYDPAISIQEYRSGAFYGLSSFEGWSPTNLYASDWNPWEALWHHEHGGWKFFPLLYTKGTPPYFPNLFYYQQIGTMVLEGNMSPYIGYYECHEDLSMGYNLSNGFPIFFVYSEADDIGGISTYNPSVLGTKVQHEQMITMLQGFGGRVDVDYKVYDDGVTPSSPADPHSWKLLDKCMGDAFKHLGFYRGLSSVEVEHQAPYLDGSYPIDLLADRCAYYVNQSQTWVPTDWDAKFYWAEILEQDTEPEDETEGTNQERIEIESTNGSGDWHQLSKVKGSVNKITNKLYVNEAYNIRRLGVDCAWGAGSNMLKTNKPILIDYQASRLNKILIDPDDYPCFDPAEQSLYLYPIPDDPAYVIGKSGSYDGKVFMQWNESTLQFDQYWERNDPTVPITNYVAVHFPAPDVSGVIDQDLKVSFENYELTATCNKTLVDHNEIFSVTVTGAAPGDQIYLLGGTKAYQFETAVESPDRQHILIDKSGPLPDVKESNPQTANNDGEAEFGQAYPLLPHPAEDYTMYIQAYKKGDATQLWKISNIIPIRVRAE